MNQKHRLEYLINYLLNEDPDKTIQYQSNDISFLTFRTLCNIREPNPVSEEFIKIQNDFLKEDLNVRGIYDSAILKPVKNDCRLFVWQGDITTLKCDAIVNAANNRLLGCFKPNHACIDNYIHTYAGVQLRLACFDIMHKQGHTEETGKAKITSAFNLPSKYIIHTVGPIIQDKVKPYQIQELRDCYINSLKLADDNNCESIAFCCISTGVFNYPQKEAAEIAVDAVLSELSVMKNIRRVIFNVFKDSDLKIYNSLLN